MFSIHYLLITLWTSIRLRTVNIEGDGLKIKAVCQSLPVICIQKRSQIETASLILSRRFPDPITRIQHLLPLYLLLALSADEMRSYLVKVSFFSLEAEITIQFCSNVTSFAVPACLFKFSSCAFIFQVVCSRKPFLRYKIVDLF